MGKAGLRGRLVAVALAVLFCGPQGLQGTETETSVNLADGNRGAVATWGGSDSPRAAGEPRTVIPVAVVAAGVGSGFVVDGYRGFAPGERSRIGTGLELGILPGDPDVYRDFRKTIVPAVEALPPEVRPVSRIFRFPTAPTAWPAVPMLPSH